MIFFLVYTRTYIFNVIKNASYPLINNSRADFINTCMSYINMREMSSLNQTTGGLCFYTHIY